MVRSAFRHLDINGDHYVTAEEIVSAMTANQDALHRIKKTQGFHAQLMQFIETNDGDNNRKLDENEFVEAMKRFAVADPTTPNEAEPE